MSAIAFKGSTPASWALSSMRRWHLMSGVPSTALESRMMVSRSVSQYSNTRLMACSCGGGGSADGKTSNQKMRRWCLPVESCSTILGYVFGARAKHHANPHKCPRERQSDVEDAMPERQMERRCSSDSDDSATFYSISDDEDATSS